MKSQSHCDAGAEVAVPALHPCNHATGRRAPLAGRCPPAPPGRAQHPQGSRSDPPIQLSWVSSAPQDPTSTLLPAESACTHTFIAMQPARATSIHQTLDTVCGCSPKSSWKLCQTKGMHKASYETKTPYWPHPVLSSSSMPGPLQPTATNSKETKAIYGYWQLGEKAGP